PRTTRGGRGEEDSADPAGKADRTAAATGAERGDGGREGEEEGRAEAKKPKCDAAAPASAAPARGEKRTAEEEEEPPRRTRRRPSDEAGRRLAEEDEEGTAEASAPRKRREDDDGWQRRLRELARYKSDHGGDCSGVPLAYRDPDDVTLGEWARRQRELRREGKLDEEQVEILEGMGFDFDREPERFTGDEAFDGKMRELMEYKKEHSHCDVPADHGGEPLGRWVRRQRELYEEGTLDEDRHAFLEEKGFAFEPGTGVKSTVLTDAWKRTYRELVQFKRDHGHLEVPANYKASVFGADLYKWISKQKGKFKRKELSRSRIRLFEEIGLDLGARKEHRGDKQDEKWESRLAELIAYRDEHGHCNVPKSPRGLGPWVRDQRKNFRHGQLRGDRFRRLSSVGFDFDPSNRMGGGGEEVAAATDNNSVTNAGGGEVAPATKADSVFDSAAWAQNHDALKKFVETHGHADVRPEYEDADLEGSLRTWIETQKRFSREGALPKRNAEMLEGLGVDLLGGGAGADQRLAHRNDAIWTHYFRALERFYEEEGHADVRSLVSFFHIVERIFPNDAGVSRQVPDDVQVDNGRGGRRPLASWLQKQREIYKSKSAKMPAERIASLERLGIDLGASKKRGRKEKPMADLLGEMPDDDSWFEDHEDGVRRRIPRDWTFPKLCLEDMYVLFHCGDKETKTSPMKLFQPSDMVVAPRDKTNLSEVKLLCSIIDEECTRKGVVVKGIVTEEVARSCVRMGYPALNIPPPQKDGAEPSDVLKMKWPTVFKKKKPVKLRESDSLLKQTK
ncbi:hypothetical protein ACHAWF_004251, partial [Thalassiosira exigua]